jgi:polyvinyl alcohol dehydrogenase (cytochrome)
MRRPVALIASIGCAVAIAATGGAVAQAATAPSGFWTSYLNGTAHSSYNPGQTAVTPANAATLGPKWSTTAGAPYNSSPIVFRGSVYIGGSDGYFYRISEHTGQVLTKVYIGKQPALTCSYSLGVTATASLARDPKTHALTVYVSGGDGYLYALGIYTLAVKWRSAIDIPSTTVNDYYDWSSPTVANGKIYVGVASSCDKPLVRAGVMAFNQATGKRLATYFTVGPKRRGGSVWSSIAVGTNGDVFATTGNGPQGLERLNHSESILKLNPNTLALLAAYQVPAADVTGDGDFGASPVVFGGLVGACNKNGIFYAVQQSNMRLAWKQRIGVPDTGPSAGSCIAAAVYDGKHLFLGGNVTTIGTTSTPGSVQERSPATGALLWETPMIGGAEGSPSLDGGGVLAVTARSPGSPGVFLVNAATGAIIEQLTTDIDFAQPAWAENELFTATSAALTAWGLPTP